MKPITRQLIGRDPQKGIMSFRTGAILNRKDRLSNRNSKAAKRALREQIRGE